MPIENYKDFEICAMYHKDQKPYYIVCKEFWGINKRDSDCLKEGVFWDNQMLNAISVYSETELTNKQAETLQRLGVA